MSAVNFVTIEKTKDVFQKVIFGINRADCFISLQSLSFSKSEIDDLTNGLYHIGTKESSIPHCMPGFSKCKCKAANETTTNKK